MALVELGTFALVVLIGCVGVWMMRNRAALRSRKKLAHRQAEPTVSPRS